MKVVLHSDEINLLIYRYLQESGFVHTAFALGAEANLVRPMTLPPTFSGSTNTPSGSHGSSSILQQLGPRLPPNCLVSMLHKALLYCWVEHHTDPETGNEILCDQPFGFFHRHHCKSDSISQENHDTYDDDDDLTNNPNDSEPSVSAPPESGPSHSSNTDIGGSHFVGDEDSMNNSSGSNQTGTTMRKDITNSAMEIVVENNHSLKGTQLLNNEANTRVTRILNHCPDGKNERLNSDISNPIIIHSIAENGPELSVPSKRDAGVLLHNNSYCNVYLNDKNNDHMTGDTDTNDYIPLHTNFQLDSNNERQQLICPPQPNAQDNTIDFLHSTTLPQQDSLAIDTSYSVSTSADSNLILSIELNEITGSTFESEKSQTAPVECSLLDNDLINDSATCSTTETIEITGNRAQLLQNDATCSDNRHNILLDSTIDQETPSISMCKRPKPSFQDSVTDTIVTNKKTRNSEDEILLTTCSKEITLNSNEDNWSTTRATECYNHGTTGGLTTKQF